MKLRSTLATLGLMLSVAAHADASAPEKKVFSFVTDVIPVDAMMIVDSMASEHENFRAEIDYEFSTPSVASKVNFYNMGMAEMGDFCQTIINFSGVRKLRLVGEHSHRVVYIKEDEALASGFFSSRNEARAPCLRHDYDQFVQNVALRSDFAYVPLLGVASHYLYFQFFNNLEELAGARAPQVQIKVKQIKDGAVVAHGGDYTLDQINLDDESIRETNFRWDDSAQSADNRVGIRRIDRP